LWKWNGNPWYGATLAADLLNAGSVERIAGTPHQQCMMGLGSLEPIGVF